MFAAVIDINHFIRKSCCCFVWLVSVHKLFKRNWKNL